MMISTAIEFLVMLNPFALFLYLEPIRKDLSEQEFNNVLFKASTISLSICILFFYVGEWIFDSLLKIDFESFRIFGGIILFSFSYMFIVKGQKALIIMKENLDDLASEIALPFMVGAGMLSLVVVLSHKSSPIEGTGILAAVFIVNFTTIYMLKKVRNSIKQKKIRKAFDKNMEVLLRLNGFFIGAIGINMVLSGIRNLFQI